MTIDPSGAMTDAGFHGVPIAIGWFLVAMCFWWVAAYFAHEKESALLAMLALGLMASAFLGIYFILLWENGF